MEIRPLTGAERKYAHKQSMQIQGQTGENKIAEFAGMEYKSGYHSYPLYLFNAEKLRGLCPDGMAAYEQENGLDKKLGKKEKDR